MGKVVAVNISGKKSMTKRSSAKIMAHGCDAAKILNQQISLLDKKFIDEVIKQDSVQIKYSDFNESIVTEDLDFNDFALLDQLHVGEIILEILGFGKECYSRKCVIPEQGVVCRVLQGGEISPGDTITHIARPLQIAIITLSDSIYAEQKQQKTPTAVADYDKAGAVAHKIIDNFFIKTRWHVQIKNILLPNDPEKLRQQLEILMLEGVDVILTLGGTGLGSRDMTPEVVSEFCDKLVSGIMEYIRLKYGAKNPKALLDRSVFGIKNQTQIYSLPHSVTAVMEYLEEVLKNIEHAVLMLHDIK